MKIGDLIVFSEGYTLKGDDLWLLPNRHRGIIIDGPTGLPRTRRGGGCVSVYWFYASGCGLWDKKRLSVLNEGG